MLHLLFLVRRIFWNLVFWIIFGFPRCAGFMVRRRPVGLCFLKNDTEIVLSTNLIFAFFFVLFICFCLWHFMVFKIIYHHHHHHHPLQPPHPDPPHLNPPWPPLTPPPPHPPPVSPHPTPFRFAPLHPLVPWHRIAWHGIDMYHKNVLVVSIVCFQVRLFLLCRIYT